MRANGFAGMKFEIVVVVDSKAMAEWSIQARWIALVGKFI